MQTKEIRQQSDKQLQNLIRENKEKLKKLRFSLSIRQLKNYSEINQTKKIVARAKTILKERILRSDNKKEKEI